MNATPTRAAPEGDEGAIERALDAALITALDGTPELDAAVVLAFNAVYTKDGVLNNVATHLYVSNDYVVALAARQPRIRFGASVHPYRRDAVAEVERCVGAGAVLLSGCRSPSASILPTRGASRCTRRSPTSGSRC